MRCDSRLNPCDCAFHAFDHLQKQRGYAGTATFLTLELTGRLEPDAVVEALRRAMGAHPATAGAAAVSFWRRWPVWRYDGTPVRPRYLFDDLSQESDWVAAAQRMFEERLSARWDDGAPGQVCLEHYRGPDQQQRLCLRWPHALMDAEGAQHFLAEISRLADDPAQRTPDHLLPDGETVDPLAGLGAGRRLRLLGQWLRAPSPRSRAAQTSLCERLPGRNVGSRRLRCLHRVWSPESVARLRAQARRLAPSGPARYTRHLAACVLRAVQRLHGEHGRALPAYGMALPMRLPGLRSRPVIGNYLVSAVVWVSAERLRDKRAVAEDIDRQLQTYLAGRKYLADWLVQRLAAGLRISQYRRLVKYHLGRQPALTGYSFFGEIDPPIRRFLGAEVTNLWGSGVLLVPPGWNPTFTRFRDRINFVLPWPEGAFPEGVVERYAALIEQEALGG